MAKLGTTFKQMIQRQKRPPESIIPKASSMGKSQLFDEAQADAVKEYLSPIIEEVESLRSQNAELRATLIHLQMENESLKADLLKIREALK